MYLFVIKNKVVPDEGKSVGEADDFVFKCIIIWIISVVKIIWEKIISVFKIIWEKNTGI